MKKTVYFVLILVAISLLGGCNYRSAAEPEADLVTIDIIDMLGREVAVSQSVEKVVAIGPGALRLYCYINGTDKVVGVEQHEKDNATRSGRPYFIANPALVDLPIIGPGGPNNAPDPEKILMLKPDVIFCANLADKASLDKLQDKIGIPVVGLSYGQQSLFDTDVYDSLKLIGKIMNSEKRAQDVVEYLENCQRDLDERTRDIADEQKPSVYVGALAYKGAHGIESTFGQYPLLDTINGRNVVDETGKTGTIMLEKEKLVEWDPQVIFIDLYGYTMVQQDYQHNPEFYSILSAVKNDKIYSQLPFNAYSTNIGTALADTYYMGKILSPEAFADVDPEEKADEIYEFLLGESVYDQMAQDFGGFRKLTLP